MDALHDNSHRIWINLANQHEALIPAYVMEASLLEKEAADALPNRNFADTTGRLFPLDSEADVWLSQAYFCKAAEAYTPALREHIQAQIKRAAEVFGIAEDCDRIRTAITAPVQEKQASDDCWGWVEKSASGEVISRSYPMQDAEQAKMACDHFVENRSKYPFQMRRTLAQNIAKQASAFSVEIPDEVRRESGQGMPRRETLMAELIDRSHLVKDAELAIVLLNMNEFVATVPMEELLPNLEKVAEIMEAVDETEGLHRQYGRHLLSPADVVFDISVKSAEAFSDDAVELDKYIFSLTKLAGLAPAVYSEVLGDDFAARITKDGKVDQEKLANELSSMIRPDKIALEQYLETAFEG